MNWLNQVRKSRQNANASYNTTSNFKHSWREIQIRIYFFLVTTVKKAGPGAFNMDSLQSAVQDGQEIGVQVQRKLLEKILKEERMGIGRKKVGFLKE